MADGRDDAETVEVGSGIFGRWLDDEQHAPPIVAEPAGGPIPDGDEADEAAPVVPNVLLDLREAKGDHNLQHYWTSGRGAALIKWRTPHDFDRCVRHLSKYVRDPEGLCNHYHQIAVGAPPGQGH
jgi:hypothetical protein